MAPTTSQEAGGSGSRARRRRRDTPVRQSPRMVTTRSRAAARSEATPSSQRDVKRGKAGKQRSTSRKRARAAVKYGEHEQDAAAAAASTAGEQVSSSSYGASSGVSSPRRCPSILQVATANDSTIHPRIVRAYIEEQEKYFAKLDRECELTTLDQSIPRSCLASRALLPVRESATRIVNHAAKVVVGLSSYVDGKLLAQCSGILIKLNEEDQVATILTSADLICTKFPSIHDKSTTREFAPHAKVDVHLLDDSIADGHLLNYHKHYNIAVLEVTVKESFQLPNLSSEVKLAQEVFVLGRDASLNLIVSHGRVDYMGPGLFENNHYMYITCGVAKCGTGGPVIDFDGTFVGMASPTRRMSFIPVSIILRCLLLKLIKPFFPCPVNLFECILFPCPDLEIGYLSCNFSDPPLLFFCTEGQCFQTSQMFGIVLELYDSILYPEDLIGTQTLVLYNRTRFIVTIREKISRKFKIDDGLIVEKVSEGSAAEKTGIRIGDIIESCNGKQIATTVDLENVLLQMCEDHLDKGHGIVLNLDVIVGVFHIRKESHRTKKLTVKLSDDMEIIAGGTYDLSLTEGFPVLSTSLDDTSQGRNFMKQVTLKSGKTYGKPML
ncbi:hypothetical protein PR202_gb24892 [Eleusine coracana subsp. coracana]|uniref:PDZ domain-containing protein n=1 Tax=Eleusine coracana subsp. coracana TaxID=191504 RepID=A0AAV5FMK1_ELECO|nr:hypothetical protein PR202_gb24892 [Eleusine coracana subsp. coracana]